MDQSPGILKSMTSAVYKNGPCWLYVQEADDPDGLHCGLHPVRIIQSTKWEAKLGSGREALQYRSENHS